MDKSSYQKYVKIDCWKIRREEYLHIHGKRCELCGKEENLIPGFFSPVQVHHLKYDRLGHELDSDLIAVCAGCHRAMHGLDRSTPIARIRQYVEMQLDCAITEKLGMILVALDKLA